MAGVIGNRGGGRPSKPLALKLVEGDAGKMGRHKLSQMLRDEEQRYTRGEPRMPDFLSKEAKREWRRMVPLLLQGRVLSEAEGIALGSLCQDIATLSVAQREVQKRGLIVRVGASRNAEGKVINEGELRIHPLLAVIDRISPRVTVGLREFGLTPASRSRIAPVASLDPDDDLYDMLPPPRPKDAVKGEPPGSAVVAPR